MFYSCFISLGLEQMVKKSTIFPPGNLLDLILCSHSFMIGNCDVLAPFLQSPHCPVICTYVFQYLSVSTNRLHSVESFIWQKVDMNLSVEVCRMLTGITSCNSWVPVSSMLDFSQFCVLLLEDMFLPPSLRLSLVSHGL